VTREVNANDVVAFLIELVALALLGLWTWRTAPDPALLQVLAVIVVVGIAVTLWSLFAAPRARFDVPALALGVKVLVLGGSVAAGFLVLPVAVAIGYGVVVVVNTALMYVGPFAR